MEARQATGTAHVENPSWITPGLDFPATTLHASPIQPHTPPPSSRPIRLVSPSFASRRAFILRVHPGDKTSPPSYRKTCSWTGGSALFAEILATSLLINLGNIFNENSASLTLRTPQPHKTACLSLITSDMHQNSIQPFAETRSDGN